MSEVKSIAIPAFEQSDKRLEVLVGTESDRQRSEEHVCRSLKAEPITGMFCRIDRNAFVTSPEMTFVQMATRLSQIELLKLGMELCGTYAFDPFSSNFDNRDPVTSKRKIAAFCRRASTVRGAAKAAKALRWIVDGSNSPAETSLMLYLCLPVRLGGYGFSLPEMNPTTQLSQQASRMLGYGSMRCDLHWQDSHVVVEYDSDQEHLNSRTASVDAARRNVLGFEDITVISVHKPMLENPIAFNGVAKQLARALGRYLRPRDLEYTDARRSLHKQLFPWVRG